MPTQINSIVRLASVVALAVGSLRSQDSTAFKDPMEEVLKVAFKTEQDSLARVPLRIAVTFLPSCHPESTVVIRFRSVTEVEGEYIRATLASGDAVERLRTANGTRSFDIGAAVAAMGIKRTRKSIDPATAKAWLTRLRTAASGLLDGRKELAPGRLIRLDDTLYRLDYLGSTEVLITTDGCEVGTDCTHDTPLVRWMDGIRREVEALFNSTEK